MRRRILVADDEKSSREGLRTLLSGWGFSVDLAADGEEAVRKAVAAPPDVVVTDMIMPKLDGLDLLRALQEQTPFSTVILLTAHGSIETAVAAMKEGAYDYLTKPVDIPRLRVLIEKAAEKGEALREVSTLRRRVKAVWGTGALVGASPAMREVSSQIELAAPTSAPVLLYGESGTGKELAARTVHDLSPRKAGPFVPVNCAAIAETLLESEIFGHEKGAFTGALTRRAGCFELAHGGTIFLDEIAEMSPATQAKFLRVLQDGFIRRVGGSAEIQVDARVIAATNQDVTKAIEAGRFREDLYYRLNVFAIALPPLRERPADVPLLVEAFLEEFRAKYDKRVRAVDEAVLATLRGHGWPGNVRELRNAIERAVIACTGEVVTSAELPPLGTGGGPAAPRAEILVGGADGVSDAGAAAPTVPLKDMERQVIFRTLASVGNNKTRAAELLGISLKTLHNKLNRYRR
jgi:DNA-binding NtrC family response regulator